MNKEKCDYCDQLITPNIEPPTDRVDFEKLPELVGVVKNIRCPECNNAGYEILDMTSYREFVYSIESSLDEKGEHNE